MVELPSKPHSGSSPSEGNVSNSFICVLPRRLGVGVYPSSQMYSSLYFVIASPLKLLTKDVLGSPGRLRRLAANSRGFKHQPCQETRGRNSTDSLAPPRQCERPAGHRVRQEIRHFAGAKRRIAKSEDSSRQRSHSDRLDDGAGLSKKRRCRNDSHSASLLCKEPCDSDIAEPYLCSSHSSVVP